MKAIFKILIYLMLLVLLTAEDCGFGSGESQQVERYESNMFQDLEDNFVSKELNAERLLALENRAVQKLQELFEYLNIYADSSLDVEFREQARQMIREAFTSETNMHQYFLTQGLHEDLENLLLLNSEGKAVKLDVSSVSIGKSFEYTNSIYKGQLNYKFQNSEAILGVKAIKIAKSFGDEKLEVWELFFEL